jgi:hypothetical protein
MRAAALGVLVVLIASCHGETVVSSGAPPSTTEADALWKLAPDGTTVGVVASPRAFAMIEHAWVDINTFMKAAPELAPYAAMAAAALSKATGSAELSLASIGLSDAKGGALFVLGPDSGIAIVPLGDRDKFLATVHGTKGDTSDKLDKNMTCMTTHGVYACASDPKLFDRLGTGHMSAAAAGARGDVEFVGTGMVFAKRPVAVVMQLERGGFTLRGTVGGMEPEITKYLGGASKPQLEGDGAAAFGVVHIKPWIGLLPSPPAIQLAPGVTPADFIATLDDPVTMTTRAGSYDVRVPLTDVKPATQLLAHCADGPLAAVGAKVVDGACQITAPNLPGMTFDVWVDDHALHAGTRAKGAGAPVDPTPLGKELADSPWQIAFYGRGSLLTVGPTISQQLQQAKLDEEVAGMLHLAVRGMMMLSEIGVAARLDGTTLHFVFGMRTAWANPDDVVAKLLAIDPDAVVAGKGPELVKPIVAAAPKSPLAGDVRVGPNGVMVPTAGIGVLAAVAIPAFKDYIKKSKVSEAAFHLNRVSKALKRSYAENPMLPVGDAPLTPAKGCCGQPNNKCPADPAAFAKDKIWSALEFSIDEPGLYQYRYHSDGKSAIVEAVGDVDCDGQPAIFTLHATVDPSTNNLQTSLVPPPAGTF